MEKYKGNTDNNRPSADCVTELRKGNTVLIVNGFFKRNASETAADKMAKVLRVESDLRAIV